ncbi:ATP-binding protein [Mucilaginibacter sp. HC2]|uniref:ATP-binding protein n=1 Tax=Mucilaginibacter inviolabilis TaxID=2714892 RepID=UPI00140B32A3|nr:ATP-binding protein [Mucilaginibacter inviolabilis]NHA04887.1 ATP-binding protein [Mucilaginibacter inviolabilis]
MKYQFNPNDFDLDEIVKIKQELHLETTSFLTIMNVCEDALTYSGMVGIIGDTGNGKTNPLKFFSEKRSNVYYVRVLKSMTPKSLFNHVLEVLGIENRYSESNVYNIIKSIAYYFNSFQSNALLIIDEAGRLSNNSLMHFHDLRNETSEKLGVVFAAPGYFKLNVEKMVKGNIQGMPEFYSRIELWIEIDSPSIEEQVEFCIHRGVKSEDLIMSIIKENQSFRRLASKLKNFGKMAIRYLKNNPDNLKGTESPSEKDI